MKPTDGFCERQTVSGFIVDENKGRDTIIKKNVKPEGSVPPWKTRETSAENAAEKQTTP